MPRSRPNFGALFQTTTRQSAGLDYRESILSLTLNRLFSYSNPAKKIAPFLRRLKFLLTICFSSKYTLQTTMTSYLIQCTKCFTLYDPAVLIAQNINTKLNKCPLCQASIKRIPKETTRQTQNLTKGTNYNL